MRSISLKSGLALIISMISVFSIAHAAENNIQFYPIKQNTAYPNWIVTNIAQGETQTFIVELNNPTPETINTDLVFKEAVQEGANFLPKNQKEFENIGNWVKIPENHFTLQPNEKKQLQYTISIPSTAPMKNYIGAIYASTTRKSNNINLVTQIGIRNYINVQPPQNFFAKFLKNFRNPITITLLLSAIGLIASILYNFMHPKKK